MRLRAAILVDNLQITRWQQKSLEFARTSIDVVLIINCRNTRSKKRYLKNFLYYALNLFTLKNTLTKRVPINVSHKQLLNFDSIQEGTWQSLPKCVYDAIDEANVDVVIKFGMGLLRLNDNHKAPPILSFHHGNPSKYRGRPAGFYEILNHEKSIGIIVQSLSNKLDAGEVYAYANSKILDYSYKKTALNFYANSVPLIKKAIANLVERSPIHMSVDGKNYRLPSNYTTLKFTALIFSNAIKRIYYGLFFEKNWNVAVSHNNLRLKENEELNSRSFTKVPIQKKYKFYADPIYSEDGKKIRLEALDYRTGLGDVIEVETQDHSSQKLLLTGKHFSYPFSFVHEGQEYLMPEVASHSAQYFIPFNRLGPKHYLKGLENKRIVDATLHFKGNKTYLFFGEKETAQTVLNLWIADCPFGEFRPHPMNPIVISPLGARMGGEIVQQQGKLLRFGQNNCGAYGASLIVMQITSLSPTNYKEVEIGEITIDKFSGPHCIGFSQDMRNILIDYYSNKFSVFAGIKRAKARISQKP